MTNINFPSYQESQFIELTLSLTKTSKTSKTQLDQWMDLAQQGCRLDCSIDFRIEQSMGQRDDVKDMRTSVLEVMLVSWPLEHLSQAASAIGGIPDVMLPNLTRLADIENLGRTYDTNETVVAQVWEDIRQAVRMSYHPKTQTQTHLNWVSPWDAILCRSFDMETDPNNAKTKNSKSFYEQVETLLAHLPPLRNEHKKNFERFEVKVQARDYLGFWMAHLAIPNAFTDEQLNKAFAYYQETSKKWWDVSSAQFEHHVISKAVGTNQKSARKASKM